MWMGASKLRGVLCAIPSIDYSCKRHYITWNVSKNWICMQRTVLVEQGFQFFGIEQNFCKAENSQVIIFWYGSISWEMRL